MPFWSFAIAADRQAPDLATGYVRAPCVADALARVAHLDANLYPLPPDFAWPSEVDGAVVVVTSALNTHPRTSRRHLVGGRVRRLLRRRP